MTRRAFIYISGARVGVLEETTGGSRFTYDRAWIERRDPLPISLTMPVRDEPFDSRGLHPFFENLLPEGWLLELSTAKLKIAKDDAFGLLVATCADCIGAVEVRPAAKDEV
jgi:HipA-like protein